MKDFSIIILRPETTGSRSARIEDLLRRLCDGGDPGRVLALTLFSDAATDDDLRHDREEIARLSGSVFDGTPPPASVVAQAPAAGAGVVLEAHVLADDPTATVARRSFDGQPYTVVITDGAKQVHAGGLGADAEGDTTARSRAAFETMHGILSAEGLDFGHIVRQWNYIERFLELGTDGRQPYQDFNDVRTEFYDTSGWPAGYPAATGIGMTTGGLVIEIVALDAPDDIDVEPVTNPRQIDAHRYSECVLVGDAPEKTPPKFERAKRVRHDGIETVFVSGTASILGEESVSVGDVAAQTRLTLENIGILAGACTPDYLRAYVKQADDIPVVSEVCRAKWPECETLYVVADVCREELLVEIEGRASIRPGADS